MAVPDYTIFQGDSSPHRLIRFESITTTNSNCRQVVRVDLDSTELIDEAVTDTATGNDGQTYFKAALSPAQTAGLTPDREYIWIVEIEANDNSEKKEIHKTIRVLKQGSTS